MIGADRERERERERVKVIRASSMASLMIMMMYIYIYIYTIKQTLFLQFISLFGQIGDEKLQNLSFKIIWLHRFYR